MDEIKSKIKTMIDDNSVVLFMKGTPDFPQCGFSANVVGLLNNLNIQYTSYDVLQDDLLRQGIKDYSSWPTIPQIYIKDEFIGGCDILNELVSSGEIESILKEKEISFNV